MSPSACNVRARIAFAIIGVFVGASIFFTFGIVYKNWDTAVFGLLSGVFAGVTLCVHWKYVQDRWATSPHFLRPLMLTGCFVQLLSICAFTVYLVLAVSQHQELTPHGPKGYFLAAVWCAMTWKWGFALFYFSQQYRNLYTSETGSPADVPYEKLPA